jgi:hypothetical protein
MSTTTIATFSRGAGVELRLELEHDGAPERGRLRLGLHVRTLRGWAREAGGVSIGLGELDKLEAALVVVRQRLAEARAKSGQRSLGL